MELKKMGFEYRATQGDLSTLEKVREDIGLEVKGMEKHEKLHFFERKMGSLPADEKKADAIIREHIGKAYEKIVRLAEEREDPLSFIEPLFNETNNVLRLTIIEHPKGVSKLLEKMEGFARKRREN